MNNQQQLCLMCLGKSIKGRNFASVKNSRWRYPVDSISFVYILKKMSNLIFSSTEVSSDSKSQCWYGYCGICEFKGNRWVNLSVTYSKSGVTDICGFYPGLLSREGDSIMLHCPPEAHATSVKLQIQSKPGQIDYLNLCEVEIYQKI